jgi:phosphoribosylamine--glycine ligase / phosphoribosylformylglycinamidine cyclo-ligase
MRVLLIGGGGREHAIADAVLRSPKLTSLAVAPGNAGTTPYNVDVDVTDHDAVAGWSLANHIDLVIVGPEAPLVAGLADDLRTAGLNVFGPSKAAAQLEGSKEFTRDFAARHGIAGPRCQAFSNSAEAIAWLDELGGIAVVKADGIAAGKGVVVPTNRAETEAAIRDMLDDGAMGVAGARVVLEELMVGEELSLFGVADGSTVVTLATAQDHKRVGDGDTGPNTGGMGSFAPVPSVDAAMQAELAAMFLEPTITGMAAEGMPYVGVLYAGIMLTAQGPRLVEYNCRFGDPEAEVILPLVTSDVLEMFDAAAHGQLDGVTVTMSTDTAATVIVCADGYPAAPRKGIEIDLPCVDDDNVVIFHAGTTRRADGTIVSSGGRVLAITGIGVDLDAALDAAYRVVETVTGSGLFARSDIGWRYAPRTSPVPVPVSTKPGGTTMAGAYAASGVSLEAGAATIDRISDAVKSTHNNQVVAGLGSFGGVFDLALVKDMDAPLMVSSTDTTGTKPILAEATGRWSGIGADIVNHGINDVLVQGARPLFMLDTVSAATLDPEIVGQIVDGMAEACRESGCVLIGGETAEVPGVLVSGAVDVAGTMIGVVERADLLPKAGIAAGHVLVGLASSGLHTNGYSLARRSLAGRRLDDEVPGGNGETFADALLAVHRSYLGPLKGALDAGLVDALAHITGGGLVDNVPRVIPATVGARIDTTSWPRAAVFDYLIDWAGIDIVEAHQILNCGIGMVCVIAPDKVDAFVATLDEPSWIIGELVDYDGTGPQVELR